MSGLDQDYLLSVVSDFVAHVVLPGIEEKGLSDTLHWSRPIDPSFQGSLAQVIDNVFAIALNTGLADTLFEEVQRVADVDDASVIDPLAALARRLGGTDPALNMIFISGLVFVALHETVHAAAGHADLPKPGSEGLGALMELEADGAAAGLTMEFSADIASMLIEDETPLDPAPDLSTGAIIGVFLALGATPEQGAEGRPDRALRVLNALSAMAWRCVGVTLVSENGDWRWPSMTDETADAAGEALRQTLIPALMLLNVSHGVQTGFPDLFTHDGGAEGDLAQDMLSIMSGQRPKLSPQGARLNDLSDQRPKFMEQLADYRRTNLWSET